MRKTSFLPFDLIQQAPTPTKRLANLNLQEPLLQYRKKQQQRKKQLCIGLKDLSANFQLRQTVVNTKLQLIPIINPQSKLLIIWNLLVGFAILFNFFMATLVVSFTQQAYLFDMNTSAGLTLNTISITLLYLDLLIRFNLGYFSRERLVTDRKLIFKNYVRFQFWFDIISIICVTIYMAAGNYSFCYVRLGIYLRIFGLAKLDQDIILSLSSNKYVLSFYKLFRMIIITYLFTTWAACVFFSIDYSYYTDVNSTFYQQDQLWLTNSQLVDGLDIITAFPQWYIWYQYALYWSIQTSSTTGYGTITPKNPPQIIYCNFIMILMTVLFAYFINYVWSIIRQVQEGSDYNDNWYKLQQYLKQLSLSSDEKDKISNYMKQIYYDDYKQQSQSFIVDNISQQLKDQYYVATKSKFYKQTIFPYLINSTLNSSKLLTKLVYLLQQCRLGKQQTIYQQGQFDNNLYFIKNGYVKLFINYSIYGRMVKNNQIIGAVQFFSCKSRNHNALTISFVKLWKLDYQAMKNCLKQDPITYELYHQIQQQIIIYKKLQKVEAVQCWRCGIFGHSTYSCQFISYQPNTQQVCAKSKNKRMQKNSQILVQSDNNQNIRQKTKRRLQKSMKLYHKIQKQDNSINIQQIKNFGTYRKQYNVQNY